MCYWNFLKRICYFFNYLCAVKRLNNVKVSLCCGINFGPEFTAEGDALDA